MQYYTVKGGQALRGEVTVSGSKNAALGIIAAAMLLDGPCEIENVPDITDVNSIIQICRELGAIMEVDRATATLYADPRPIHTHMAVSSLARKIRASCYLQGALLGRPAHEATVALPGGCNFGARPIDQHVKGFEALGAEVSIAYGNIQIRADQLVGNHIYLDKTSVGATINLIIAATKAEGQTVIANAAREPHIVDVANFLNTMGAKIRGAGTDTIRITGVSHLPGACSYSIIPDQIEAGTYMIAAAATRGDVTVKNLIPKHMEPLTIKLEEMGIDVETGDDWIRVACPPERKVRPSVFKTKPYPGFPTDLQPQAVVLLCIAEGESTMHENVWDNRFQYINDLQSMGAQVEVNGHAAIVRGPNRLTASSVFAHDLRAGAAMVIAGLMAEGETRINKVASIQRGYERLIEKMRGLGGEIQVHEEAQEAIE